MGKSSKKPRPKMDARKYEETQRTQVKKDRDWSFDEIARSKTRRH